MNFIYQQTGERSSVLKVLNISDNSTPNLKINIVLYSYYYD